jgi:uroporphyrinogen-III decarboxylase
MTAEDYDRILDDGWPGFSEAFLKERVFNDVPPELLPWNQPAVDTRGKWGALGVPVLMYGNISTPFELLCGGRSLVNFIRDLFIMPDKIEAVMDAIVPHLTPRICQGARELGYPAVWVGGWRSASNMLSPKLWERFVWPYFQRLVNEVVDSGLIAILHMDADWTRDLGRFRELPRGRCVLATDGATDLLKAKEILGDHMCLMGDVPATMLSLGSPGEVYEYSSKLIRQLGPEGFILQSGCDIPLNAKLENVRAMVAAATGQ